MGGALLQAVLWSLSVTPISGQDLFKYYLVLMSTIPPKRLLRVLGFLEARDTDAGRHNTPSSSFCPGAPSSVREGQEVIVPFWLGSPFLCTSLAFVSVLTLFTSLLPPTS